MRAMLGVAALRRNEVEAVLLLRRNPPNAEDGANATASAASAAKITALRYILSRSISRRLSGPLNVRLLLDALDPLSPQSFAVPQ